MNRRLRERVWHHTRSGYTTSSRQADIQNIKTQPLDIPRDEDLGCPAGGVGIFLVVCLFGVLLICCLL